MSCEVFHAQYVWSTRTKFRLRFNNHKSRFKAHSRLSVDRRDKDDLVLSLSMVCDACNGHSS